MSFAEISSATPGESSAVVRERVIAVIGGVISSTLLTLVVLPVLYTLVAGRRRRLPATETA